MRFIEQKTTIFVVCSVREAITIHHDFWEKVYHHRPDWPL